MVLDSDHPQDVLSKVKIFISYSRRDMDFVDRLEAAVDARGIEPLIDRSEIYAFEDWWQRIEGLIDQADTVVFVISPDAVASEVALKEVTYAASLNKRFAPIVCRRVESDALPLPLRRLNFIFFDDPGQAEFDASVDRLITALRTDIGWIRQHTTYGEAALHWSASDRPGGLLLRSPSLEQAERWIASRPAGAPAPTELTKVFIAESRSGVSRRRNILTGSLTAGIIFSFALAALAYWQRGEAIQQRNLADSRRLASLAELASGQRLQGNLDSALRIAVHGARLADALHVNDAEMAHQRSALAAAVWNSMWQLFIGNVQGFDGEISPDGSLILSSPLGDVNAIYVRDAGTGDQKAILRGHEKIVYSGAFSHDGSRIVTTSADNTARIWNASTGKEIVIFHGTDLAFKATFNQDGTRVLTIGFNHPDATIWDATTGLVTAVLKNVSDASFSKDGLQIVTVSSVQDDYVVSVWNSLSGKKIQELHGHSDTVLSASFNPDGSQIATASGDNTARVWYVATGQIIATLQHQDVVNYVAFSSDGSRVLTKELDRTVHVWNVDTGKEIIVLRNNDFASVEFSPNGSRLITRSDHDKAARIWDAWTGKEIAVLSGHENIVNQASFAADGSRIVTRSANTVRVWSGSIGDPVSEIRGPYTVLENAAFSSDGLRIVISCWNDTAQIWDSKTGKPIKVLKGHTDTVNSANFSPDGLRIVTSSYDKTARIWDAQSGKQIVVLNGHVDYVTSAKFSPDGSRIVTSSRDGTAIVWDSQSGKQITVLRGHTDEVRSANFSPDGLQIVTSSSDGTARIWDAGSGNEIALLQHEVGVHDASFSPDGWRIVTVAFIPRVWQAQSGKEIAVLNGHRASATSASFSPDGTRIFTASLDKTVRIWDASSGNEIAVLSETAELKHVSLSRDGTKIVTASSETARVWDVHIALMSTHDLVTEVCHRLLPNSTTLDRNEMRLVGYADADSQFDVCADK